MRRGDIYHDDMILLSKVCYSSIFIYIYTVFVLFKKVQTRTPHKERTDRYKRDIDKEDYYYFFLYGMSVQREYVGMSIFIQFGTPLVVVAGLKRVVCLCPWELIIYSIMFLCVSLPLSFKIALRCGRFPIVIIINN